MNFAVFISVIAASTLIITFAEGSEDERCKCVCPKDLKSNETNVKIVKNIAAKDCNCPYVVRREESYCLRCQCQFENRNTALIKVVIIFILVVLLILILYMIFLFIESKIRPPPLSISADVDEETPLLASLPSTASDTSTRRQTNLRGRLDTNINRWKVTVEEQRKNIYVHHNLLS